MTGEHVYAIKDSDTDSKQQDKEALFEQFSDKASGDYKSSLSQNSSASPEGKAANGAKFCVKEKESYPQREAVIRPRQTGKIDFKSLQNRPKFTSDRTWPSGKGSPQSPTGKSKGRDKNKRPGKGDRNPQQLYRLSMTSSRSNPTIGIAYPQQKVTPPKKLETTRGSITGSYRFHVPSIPEREAELQQEDLNYNRCIQEAPSNLTSTNYTSQAAAGAQQQHPLQQQTNNLPRENTPTSGQLHYPEFQSNGTSSWHSAEKSFGGVNYGISSLQKPAHFPEVNKATFGPLPFQYGFSPLQDATSDPFPNDHSQDYVDVSLANNQVAHSDFAFKSSEDGQEESLSNGQYDNLQLDGRTYPQPSQQAPFFQPSHGTQSTCYKGRTDHSAEMDGAVSTPCPVEQSHNTFPENKAIFTQEEMNLHNSGASTVSVNKRSSPSKDNVSSQRILSQGNPLMRNLAQGSLSQMHFQGKTYGSSPVNSTPGLVPFDKNIPNTMKNHLRLSQPWDGENKTFSSIDQNAAPYSTPTDNQFQFQCQPAVEQRQHMAKNCRLPWQQIHLTSAMPNQNRIELSRQLSNQKLPFPLAASEWQEENKSHKNTSPSNLSSFHGKRQSEGFTKPRNEGTKQNCSPATTFLLENEVSTNPQMSNSRNKSMFFGLNQSMTSAPSRTNNHLPLPPGSLMGASPYESPLPSPVQNPSSSSTCSSLSPISSSPANTSSEDSQLPMAGPPPPFYQQHCHLKEGKSIPAPDQINPSLHHLHPDASRAFPHPTERTKDDLLNYLHDNKFSKQNMDNGKACLNSFGVEHPPPPPYSAHQLLANSLTSANLDQLDVLLTCKQCDQNYSNLASFLEHRQYCGLHAISQSEFKETTRMEESRKFQMDPAKITQTTPAFPLSRCSSDLHLSLLGLNKNGELLLDGDAKGDPKDDPLKLNLFNGMMAPSSLTASDLDIDDAKLDSLITEALNGLGYQSDNAEIDSSFIDAFADDDLSTAKTMGSGHAKIKDSLLFESKNKHLTVDERQTSQSKTFFVFDRDNMSTDKNLVQDFEKKHKEFKKEEKDNVSHKKSGGHFFDKSSEKLERIKLVRKPNSSCVQESVNETKALCSKNCSERNGQKSHQDSPNIVRGSLSEVSAVNTSLGMHRFGVKENKKRKSGTWSKELIHKIVQQKNKLHKLHVKGSKNLPFSLVMERLVPAPQNSKLGEYDYISDSDDETEPLKVSARSRMGPGLSGRPKYSYTKEHKGRGGRAEKQTTWKHGPKDRGLESRSTEALSPPQMKDNSGRRVRRRSSRSSTSSDLSTPASFSSESIKSPKSTDRTDSDNEKGSPENMSSSIEVTLPDSFEQEVFKRVPNVSKKYCTTDFSKNTKRYGSAKFLFASRKSNHQQRNIFLHSSYRMEESLSELSTVKTYSINKTQESFDSKGTFMQDPKLSSESCATTTEVSERIENAVNSLNFNSTVRKGVASYKGSVADYCNDESVVKSSQTSETIPDVNTDIADCKKNTKKGVLAIKTSEFESNSRDFHDSSAVKISDVSPFLEIMDHGKLSNQYDCDVYSKPLPVTSSEADNIYLCPSDLHKDSIQKTHSKQCTMSYPMDNEQSLVKSPLSFDTSSMFGEISVPGFDNSLYTDGSKDSYDTFNSNNTDKRTLFESTYPPFFEQKDWNIMDEVSPMLSEDISNFPDLSVDKALNKDYKSISPRQMPLALTDKMSDYNAPFVSNTFDDELEIKRIVTELESQLQTSKLKSGVSEQLTSNSKFPTLHLHQEPESEKDMLLTDTIRGTRADPRIQEHYDDQDHPWSCTFQFGSLDAQPCLHMPEHDEPSSLDHFYSKKDQTENSEITVKEREAPEEKQKGHTIAIAGPLSDKSEEILENQKYTENLMKSLEVISDSIFNKGTLSDDQEVSQFLNKEYRRESNSAVQKQDKTEGSSHSVESNAGDIESEFVKHKALLFPSGDPDCSNNGDVALSPKITTHQSSIINLESDIEEFQDEPVSDQKTEPDQSEPPLTAQQTDSETPKTQIVEEKTKGNGNLATEISCTLEKDTCIDSTVNPLQQLQLFVARNIKHNEEEMIMPSYPVLLSTIPVSIAHDQSEEKEENLKNLPSTETSNIPKNKLKDNNYLNEKEQSNMGVFKKENMSALTAKQESHHSDQMLKPKMSESSSHEFQNATQPQHLTDELCKNNISTPGIAAEHNDLLSPCSTTTKALPEPSNQILVKPEHGDGEKQALTFRENDTLESCDTLVDDLVLKQNTDCKKRKDQLVQLSSTTYSLLHQCAEEESKEQAEGNAVEAHNNPFQSVNHNDLYDQHNAQKMWHNFDRLSPISMDNAHSPRQGDILSTNSVVLPHSDESISSGLSYSFVDLSHISIDKPKNESLTIDCEASVICKIPLVNILEPSDSLNNGEDAFKGTHTLLDQQSGPNQDLPYVLKQSPLNYTILQVHNAIAGPSNECKDSQAFYDESIGNNYDCSEVRLPLPLTCKESLKPDSHVPDRSSSDSCDSRVDIEVNLCSSAVSVQSIECTCPELLCFHDKENNVTSIANAKLDFQSMSHGITNVCHSPLATIEYMDLHSDHLKKSDSVVLDMSLKSPQAEKETVSLSHETLDNSETLQPLEKCIDCSSGTETSRQSDQVPQIEEITKPIKIEEKDIADKTESKNESNIPKKNGTKLCDICSASFRSNPGLKRHKAMKHNVKKGEAIKQEKALEYIPSCQLQADQQAVLKVKTDVSINVTVEDKCTVENNVQLHMLEKGQNDTLPQSDQQVSSPCEDMESCNRVSSEVNLPPFGISQKEISTAVDEDDEAGTTAEINKTNKRTMLGPERKQKLFNPHVKSKRAGKTLKSRNVNNSNGSYFELKGKMAEHFSEDILTILKSDILQAITPNFPGISRDKNKTDPPLQESEEKPISKNAGQLEVKDNNVFSYELKHDKEFMTLSPGKTDLHLPVQMVCLTETEDQVSKPHIKGVELGEVTEKGTEENRMCYVYEGEDERNMKGMFEQKAIVPEASHSKILGDSVEMNCTKSSCIPKSTEWVGTPPYPYEAPSSSISKSQSDLQSVLDDESTFSQLFPRDDQMIRKKCTRVYGKRNKKQKPTPKLFIDEPIAVRLAPTDKKQDTDNFVNNNFVSKTSDHCKYEKISTNDALMLEMCHKSPLKNDKVVSSFENATLRSEGETDHESERPNDKDSHTIMEFLCPNNQAGNKPALPAVVWAGAKDPVTDIAADTLPSLESSKDFKSDDLAITCNQDSSHPSDSLVSVARNPDNPSQFHTIDIQNLNTKFQLPDIHFFDSTKDTPACASKSNNDTLSLTMKASQRLEEVKPKFQSEISKKSKDRQYKCKVCFKWFQTLWELNFHKPSHNPSPPPTCYMCVQRKFSSREQLRDHLKEKHAKNKAGIWTCGMCLKEISNVWMYNEHLREHAIQFARKGQAQQSVLGMPGCFMEQTAVKHFLSSIMQRRPSKSKNNEASTKSPSNKDTTAVKENVELDPKIKEENDATVKNKLNSSCVGKLSTNMSSETMQESEHVQKPVTMHPNCKDPSRDCHHCGKQFPKPFKLQRHLVVHSFKKMYLCHKCPVFYQDLQELKTHVKEEHQDIEEPEIKHTTLYACELCADVMHVIKKSFICSTCNYTFSKKEQYDRHMEKHLAEGSKTFKFRGVMRPCKPSKDVDFELQATITDTRRCSPPRKKRKISPDSLIETSLDSGISSVVSLHFNHNIKTHASKEPLPVTSDFFSEAIDNPPDLQDMTIKTENDVDDLSEYLAEMEESQFNIVPEASCLLPSISNAQTGDPPSPEVPTEEVDIQSAPCLSTSQKDVADVHYEQHTQSLSNVDDIVSSIRCEVGSGSSDLKNPKETIEKTKPSTDDDSQCNKLSKEEREWSESIKSVSENTDLQSESFVVDKSSGTQNLFRQDGTSQCIAEDILKASEANAKQIGELQKLSVGGQQKSESEKKGSKTSDNHNSCQAKEKASLKSTESSKQSFDCTKPADVIQKHSIECSGSDETRLNGIKHIAYNVGKEEEKESVQSSPKLHQKKRKEYKTSLGSKLSTATRENMDSDVKKKKVRVQSPLKNESTGSSRKIDIANDPPFLSSARDDMTSNKLHVKQKIGGINNIQPKKNSFDSYPPKKVDMRHSNLDFKGKKGIFRKPLHSALSKGLSPFVNGSLKKHRTVPGVTSPEPHTYRTAESQNHLLSQLFGQKLTSFKIPLRKDSSE